LLLQERRDECRVGGPDDAAQREGADAVDDSDQWDHGGVTPQPATITSATVNSDGNIRDHSKTSAVRPLLRF
jgi:hypothetical protein